ncbi:DUF6377 domain-containing protein [Prevotella sp. P3-122]|uniref:DUF6377 domain-containing protein n=1 Tax=Prevotella sp. P3-122 TaxID=2024223 RepID=UPI001140316B|nr:DUF6377 domain-containing protein [Prevotella sp. P3-122]
MRCLLTLLMSVVSFYVFADNEELYRSLDEAIVQAPDFVKKREQRIDVIKQRLQNVANDEERYQLTCNLFNEYMPYKSDSAAKYIYEAILLAEKRGNKSQLCHTRSLLAFLCSSTGQYVESKQILDSTDISGVDREALGQFYKSLAHVYGEMAYYSNIPKLKNEFFAKQDEYTEKIYEILPPSHDFYLQRKEQECYKKGDIEGALRYNDKRLENVSPDSHEFAIVAFYRTMDLRMAGRPKEALSWLTKSAICDVHNAVMDQGSLWELANLLSQEGQLERARVYINFAWECANTYSTHMRSWQISPILSSIDRQYQNEIEHTNSMLTNMTIAVSILLLILAVLLLYEYRRRRQLKEAHNELSEKNAQTKSLNEELLQANLALDDTNRQLKTLISQLNEQTRVKEVYVGRFMSLCSDYIDKIDDFRKRVNRMVKGREYEELYRLTKSTDMKTQEIEDLCANFDNAFLHLFPNFISDFNALLRPEEQIEVPGEYKLNTTLRIFALIRLGIDDSSRIAKFLHYSVNTIYNYRARVKGAAITRRDDFETRVKNIGM